MPEESTWVTCVAVGAGGTGVLVGGTGVPVGLGAIVGGAVGVGVGVFGMQLIVTRSGPALFGWSASTVTAVAVAQLATSRFSVTFNVGSDEVLASTCVVSTKMSRLPWPLMAVRLPVQVLDGAGLSPTEQAVTFSVLPGRLELMRKAPLSS